MEGSKLNFGSKLLDLVRNGLALSLVMIIPSGFAIGELSENLNTENNSDKVVGSTIDGISRNPYEILGYTDEVEMLSEISNNVYILDDKLFFRNSENGNKVSDNYFYIINEMLGILSAQYYDEGRNMRHLMPPSTERVYDTKFLIPAEELIKRANLACDVANMNFLATNMNDDQELASFYKKLIDSSVVLLNSSVGLNNRIDESIEVNTGSNASAIDKLGEALDESSRKNLYVGHEHDLDRPFDVEDREVICIDELTYDTAINVKFSIAKAVIPYGLEDSSGVGNNPWFNFRAGKGIEEAIMRVEDVYKILVADLPIVGPNEPSSQEAMWLRDLLPYVIEQIETFLEKVGSYDKKNLDDVQALNDAISVVNGAVLSGSVYNDPYVTQKELDLFSGLDLQSEAASKVIDKIGNGENTIAILVDGTEIYSVPPVSDFVKGPGNKVR